MLIEAGTQSPVSSVLTCTSPRIKLKRMPPRSEALAQTAGISIKDSKNIGISLFMVDLSLVYFSCLI
jgi:hypothetical protein